MTACNPSEQISCPFCPASTISIKKETDFRVYIPSFHIIPMYTSLFQKCHISQLMNIPEIIEIAKIARHILIIENLLNRFYEHNFLVTNILLPMLELLE
jgi:hypothetical protein